MITTVSVSKAAEKDLRRVPNHVARTLQLWVKDVRLRGVEEVRKTTSYHDEPLHGQRRGQRSIRLSRAYRAIYVVRRDATLEFISVQEVSKHDY